MDGSKYDNGKPRVGEMLQDFAEPLLEVTKAWEYGASKYEERNWRKVDNGETRYTNALLRHLIEEETNPCDEESRLLHATHVAWNALARLWFILREQKSKTLTINESYSKRFKDGNDFNHIDCIRDFFDCNKSLYLDKDIHTTKVGDINVIDKKIDG